MSARPPPSSRRRARLMAGTRAGGSWRRTPPSSCICRKSRSCRTVWARACAALTHSQKIFFSSVPSLSRRARRLRIASSAGGGGLERSASARGGGRPRRDRLEKASEAEVRLADVVVCEEGGARAAEDDAPVLEHVRAVRDRACLEHVLLDEENRHTRVVHVLNDPEDVCDEDRGEAEGTLAKQSAT